MKNNKMSNVLLALLLFWLSLAVRPLSAEPQGVTLAPSFSDEELTSILKEDGYQVVKQLRPSVILLRVNGQNILLLNHKDGDLQLYYAVSGVQLSYAAINEWNRTKRLSRAYMTLKKDAVLEADLLANAGLSKRHVTEFVMVFVDSVRIFRQFLIKNSEKENEKDKEPDSKKTNTISS